MQPILLSYINLHALSPGKRIMPFLNTLLRPLQGSPKTLLSLLISLSALALFSLSQNLASPMLSPQISHLAQAGDPANSAYQAGLERYGSYEHLSLKLSSPDSALLEKASTEAMLDIQREFGDLALSVEGAGDDQFFQNHALYYLDSKQLREIGVQLRQWRDCMQKSAACPAENKEALRLQAGAYPPDVEKTLNRILAGKNLNTMDYDSVQKTWNTSIQIRPRGPATDLKLSAELWNRAQVLSHKWNSQGLQSKWSGPYTLAPKFWSKLPKIALSALVGLGLLVLFLWILRPRTLGSSLIALGAALSASLSSGALSLWILLHSSVQMDLFALSAWLMALGLGLGLAFSWALSILDDREADALKRTQKGLRPWIWPSISLWIGTLLALAICQFSDFAGFKIWGQVFGLSLLGLSIWNLGWIILFCLCFKTLPAPKKHLLEIYPDPKARSWAFGIGMLSLFALFLWGIPQLQIQAQAFTRFQLKQNLVPEQANEESMILLSSSPAELGTLLQSLDQKPIPGIKVSLSPLSIYPSAAEQEERSIWIEDIHKLSQHPLFKGAPGPIQAWTAELQKLSATKPFGLREIPAWTQDLLREKDGNYGRIALISALYPTGHFQAAQKYAQALKQRDPQILISSPDLVYASLWDQMINNRTWMLWSVLALLLCLLLLNWNHWRRALQPIFLGALWLWCSTGLWLLLSHVLNPLMWTLIWLGGLYALCLLLWSAFPSTSPRTNHDS